MGNNFVYDFIQPFLTAFNFHYLFTSTGQTTKTENQ